LVGTVLSAAIAVAIPGILLLEGIHSTPVPREGGLGRWLPWLLWLLALLACPVGIACIGVLHFNDGPPSHDRFATRVVDALGKFVSRPGTVLAASHALDSPDRLNP
jgi:hypothetical protein